MTPLDLHHFMRLRNILHGAPVPAESIRRYLREADEAFNALPWGRYPIHKDSAYYQALADKLVLGLQASGVRQDGDHVVMVKIL